MNIHDMTDDWAARLRLVLVAGGMAIAVIGWILRREASYWTFDLGALRRWPARRPWRADELQRLRRAGAI